VVDEELVVVVVLLVVVVVVWVVEHSPIGSWSSKKFWGCVQSQSSS
jgi:hypothetical protein